MHFYVSLVLEYIFQSELEANGQDFNPSALRLHWSYRVICLLDVISKLVERTAGHLIADHLERKKGLHEGQYGCRKRRSCIDAVAVLMNRTQQAWHRKKIAGALFMDALGYKKCVFYAFYDNCVRIAQLISPMIA